MNSITLGSGSSAGYLDSGPYQSNQAYGSYAYLTSGDLFSTSIAKVLMRPYHVTDDDCFNLDYATYYPQEIYAVGLGKVADFAYNFGAGYYSTSLVYYNKGCFEWGTPPACDYSIGIRNPALSLNLSAFPNPVHNQLILSGNFSSSQIHITILNSLGKEMQMKELSNHFGSIAFDIHQLPEGFYILQVKGRSEVVDLKFLKN